MKINKLTAEQEFAKWFEAKKLPKNLLDRNADDKEAIIGAIEEGILILNDKNEFIQKLQFDYDTGGEPLKELTFAFRVPEGVLSASLKGVKTDDLIGQMAICYISVLTGQNKGIIRALDPVDSYIGKKIAAFFFI